MYKIVCDDLDVLYTYAGSTTDFIKRKYQHIRNSKNEYKAHLKLYQIINENGGWENFTIVKL